MTLLDLSHSIEKLTPFEGEIPVNNWYTAGIAVEPFLRKLQEGTITGSRGKDGVVHVPPILYDERTLERLTESVEVEGDPQLYSYTVVHLDKDEKRLENPTVLGYVTWPGVKGGLLHRILADPEDLTIGMTVEARFRPESEREGTILDIEGFEPA